MTKAFIEKGAALRILIGACFLLSASHARATVEHCVDEWAGRPRNVLDYVYADSVLGAYAKKLLYNPTVTKSELQSLYNRYGSAPDAIFRDKVEELVALKQSERVTGVWRVLGSSEKWAYSKALNEGAISYSEHLALMRMLDLPGVDQYLISTLSRSELNSRFSNFIKHNDPTSPRTLLDVSDFAHPEIQYLLSGTKDFAEVYPKIRSRLESTPYYFGIDAKKLVYDRLVTDLGKNEKIEMRERMAALIDGYRSGAFYADLNRVFKKSLTPESAEKQVLKVLRQYSLIESPPPSEISEVVSKIVQDLFRKPAFRNPGLAELIDPKRLIAEPLVGAEKIRDSISDPDVKRIFNGFIDDFRNQGQFKALGVFLLRLERTRQSTGSETEALKTALKERIAELRETIKREDLDPEKRKMLEQMEAQLSKINSSPESLTAIEKVLPEIKEFHRRVNVTLAIKEILSAPDSAVAREKIGLLLGYHTKVDELPREHREALDTVFQELQTAAAANRDRLRRTVPSATERGFPYGFENRDQFRNFAAALQNSTRGADGKKPPIIFFGSSVRGTSFKSKNIEGGVTGIRPFDKSKSDIDLALEVPDAMFDVLTKKDRTGRQNNGVYFPSREPGRIQEYLTPIHITFSNSGKYEPRPSDPFSLYSMIEKTNAHLKTLGDKHEDHAPLSDFLARLSKLRDFVESENFWKTAGTPRGLKFSVSIYRNEAAQLSHPEPVLTFLPK